MKEQDLSPEPIASAVRSHPEFDRHESVVIHEDEKLRAIIAVHNSNLGPATGGCRIYPYGGIDAALTDVLRLSRGMTYKSAMAGLPLGGGKSVIVADPARDKSRDLLLAMGNFIESFEGRYIAAEDSGTKVEDIRVMAERTAHVSGIRGDDEFGGDPSPVTAYGVFLGIQAAVQHKFGSDLQGIRVAVQGIGNVGYRLVGLLRDAGAEVVVADANSSAVARIVEASAVASCAPADILGADVDVFAPCAMGGVIDSEGVSRLRAKVVAGAANNQLAHDAVGEELFRHGILYAPDYVINSGGIIDIHYQQRGQRDAEVVGSHVRQIGTTLKSIFSESDQQRRATNVIADEMARARFLAPTKKVVAA